MKPTKLKLNFFEAAVTYAALRSMQESYIARFQYDTEPMERAEMLIELKAIESVIAKLGYDPLGGGVYDR